MKHRRGLDRPAFCILARTRRHQAARALRRPLLRIGPVEIGTNARFNELLDGLRPARPFIAAIIAGKGIAQHECRNAFGIQRIKILSDASPHRKPAQMGFLGAEMIQDTRQVMCKIAKIQVAFVIVRGAVTPRIPGNGPKMRRKARQLQMPAELIAANTMQEDKQGPLAHDIYRQTRRARDEFVPPGCFAHFFSSRIVNTILP